MVARGQHHTAERRVLPPRRTDLERRAGERRLELISLEQERRDQAERRHATDRRHPAGRRQVEVGHHAQLAVLVVSQHDEAALRVRDLLNGAAPDRFAVAAAAPNESPARLARGGVDVVLLAVSLSERRGFATFTELRALAPTVPFLFLSNSKDERHGLEALRAGAQDVLLNSELDGERLARALRHAIERNRLHAALLDLALVDELTGLYNRRGFLTLATRDLRVARRGDETLLRRIFRDSDLVARIGGDEYAVLVRHAGPESAGVLAARMERQVRDFNRRAGRPYQVSISLGFAAHKASTLDSVAGLLDRADRALYRDKRRKHDKG